MAGLRQVSQRTLVWGACWLPDRGKTVTKKVRIEHSWVALREKQIPQVVENLESVVKPKEALERALLRVKQAIQIQPSGPTRPHRHFRLHPTPAGKPRNPSRHRRQPNAVTDCILSRASPRRFRVRTEPRRRGGAAPDGPWPRTLATVGCPIA